MFKTLKSFYFSLFFLFLLLASAAPAKAEVMAPKIIKLSVAESIALAGEAPAGSEVLIYLDGKFVGQAEAKALVKAEPSFNFQFKPEIKLVDGTHSLMAVAQDKTSLVMSAPSAEIKFAVNQVPAPTLLAPNENTATADLKPLVLGLTKSQTKVKVFIDDVLNGQTEVLTHLSGTANFAYRPALALSRGWHKIYITAEDQTGKTSQLSAVFNFRIELPMPAPTMFPPVANLNTTAARPFIVGLAKNDSRIKVYIDKKYSGEFVVKNHQSGTANFAYRPALALSRGSHQVHTVALDKRGKVSINSNLINFQVKAATIAQGAEEARQQAVANIEEARQPEKTESGAAVISGSTGQVESQPASEPTKQPTPPAAVKPVAEKQQLTSPEAVMDLLGTSSARARAAQGLVNESKQNQGKLKLGVVLFILFLVGVVGWLLWVNRELIKERQAQAGAEEKKESAPDQEQDKLL